MNTLRKVIGITLLLSTAAIVGQAQTRTVAQNNSQAVRQTLRRIENNIVLLRNSLTAADRNPVNNTRNEDNVNVLLTNLTDSAQQLRQGINRREATADDARQVLDQASVLDSFMRRRNVDARSQRYWSTLRGDFTLLARSYGLTWPDTNSTYRNRTPRNVSARLTGTYRLDTSRSGDPTAAVDRALRSVPYQQRQRVREQLLRRLDPPEQIAIDLRGRNVTLASTRAPQISFDVDGREHVETMDNGRTIRVSSSLNGEQLTVTTVGDRNNQFNVTFIPIDGGRTLQVTRRVYAENVNTPVEIQSLYERTSDVAQFDIFNGTQNQTIGNTDDFILRNGERVVAELNDALSTSTSRDGDRFTATVRSPEQYSGAVIEGHVSNVQRSGRITGRSELTFSFDRIRLRDGRSYRFAGILDSVRLPNGEIAKIDNEGAIQEDSQSTKTVQRTAIGTAVGAIIGAIAGGGKGAAIGAVIGAGGGAGSVYIQGRDDLDLPRGSEITIQATGPNR